MVGGLLMTCFRWLSVFDERKWDFFLSLFLCVSRAFIWLENFSSFFWKKLSENNWIKQSLNWITRKTARSIQITIENSWSNLGNFAIQKQSSNNVYRSVNIFHTKDFVYFKTNPIECINYSILISSSLEAHFNSHARNPRKSIIKPVYCSTTTTTTLNDCHQQILIKTLFSISNSKNRKQSTEW